MERMGTQPSVMKHSFSQVPRAEIQRSSFDRMHGHKTTFDGGYLVPVFIDEALPGDTFNLRMSAFARLATPLHPLMDNMVLTSFFFAVPNRLLWSNWERFNGAQDNPGDSVDYLVPQVTAPVGGWTSGSVADYFGIPIGVDPLPVNALAFRAMNLIWNEWFRDQNLQASQPVPLDDGPDDPANYKLMRRGKRYDYFTSCLPWPQKGSAVELPLGDQAPVMGIGQFTSGTIATASREVTETGGAVSTYDFARATSSTNNLQVAFKDATDPGGEPQIFADLSEATAATINQLRQAFQVQRMYERDARGGTRYTEIVLSHFGVSSPDARLQRPEYLGGGSSPVGITPVAQTSSTDATTPQGNLAAVGTSSIGGHGFTKSFTEHCMVIGFVAVRADLTYQQGLERMWSRQTRFDFYWPALSHLGEQEVLSKEIYADGTAGDETVFGYQERYAEYRYKPSRITGQFRSSFAQSLDTWHLSQDFSPRPTLSANFIEDTPPIDRVIAVPTEPQFLFDSSFRFVCARPMPVYSVPGLIDHF